MFGGVRLAPAAGCSAATVSSVDHAACGSSRVLKVSPCLSIFAGDVAEILVARSNSSRL